MTPGPNRTRPRPPASRRGPFHARPRPRPRPRPGPPVPRSPAPRATWPETPGGGRRGGDYRGGEQRGGRTPRGHAPERPPETVARYHAREGGGVEKRAEALPRERPPAPAPGPRPSPRPAPAPALPGGHIRRYDPRSPPRFGIGPRRSRAACEIAHPSPHLFLCALHSLCAAFTPAVSLSWLCAKRSPAELWWREREDLMRI